MAFGVNVSLPNWKLEVVLIDVFLTVEGIVAVALPETELPEEPVVVTFYR